MDLVCGNLGVSARLPEAIALAHRFGFESVAPDAGYPQVALRQPDLGAAGRPEGEASRLGCGRAARRLPRRARPRFETGLKTLAAEARALQARGPRGWAPGSRRGTTT